MWIARIILLIGLWLYTPVGAAETLTPNSESTAKNVTGRYASIVVDAHNLDIIHARQIDELRYPASLTKVMTLILTFDALESGQISLSTRLPVSRFAAATPPGKLGLRKGQTISVDNAIKALAVKSANDVAVVLAEHLSGDVERFAAQMSTKAASIGMVNTQFKNPHGLPNIDQFTTARDMAKLASHVLTAYPQYYHYFGIKTFTYKGTPYKNTNALLPWLAGVDGFKTGYTRASGYNLIISADRGGRRIIAVVLGGATGKSRNSHMQDLIERSFDVLGVAPVISIQPKSTVVIRKDVPQKTAPKVASAVRLRGRNSAPLTVISGPAAHERPITVQAAALDDQWAIQVGAFNSEAGAQAQINAVKAIVKQGRAEIIPTQRGAQMLYRARLKGFRFDDAHAGCRALSALKTGCLVISPNG